MKTLRGMRAWGILLLWAASACGQGPDERAIAAFREGNAQFGRQKFDAAQRSYTSALERDAGYLPARIMLGKLHYYQHRLPEAERAFEAVLDRESGHIEGLLWMAKVHSRSPEKDALKRAHARLDRLLSLDGSHVEGWYLKGSLHEREGKIPDAIAAYRMSVRSAEHMALAHLRLGIVFRKAGLNEQAERHRRAAELGAGENRALLLEIEKVWRSGQ